MKCLKNFKKILDFTIDFGIECSLHYYGAVCITMLIFMGIYIAPFS